MAGGEPGATGVSVTPTDDVSASLREDSEVTWSFPFSILGQKNRVYLYVALGQK